MGIIVNENSEILEISEFFVNRKNYIIDQGGSPL